VTTVPFTMQVPGFIVTEAPPDVSVTGAAVQGWVVVVVVGNVVVVVVVVVVVGCFLLGWTDAGCGTVLADTATPVPTRTIPTTNAPIPTVPKRRATNPERLTVFPLFSGQVHLTPDFSALTDVLDARFL
jgi:hypothetical protein